LRAADVADSDGRVRPPTPLGGAVPRGGRGAVGLGSVPGPPVDGVPSACGDGDAGLQLPGLAGMAAEASSARSWSPPPGFFPLGRIAAACAYRGYIARWSIGSDTRRGVSSKPEVSSLSTARC